MNWIVVYNPELEGHIDKYYNLVVALRKVFDGRKTAGIHIENLKIKGEQEEFVLNVYGEKSHVQRLDNNEVDLGDYILTITKDELSYVVKDIVN